MVSEEQVSDQIDLSKGFRLGDWAVLPTRGVLRSGDREERPEPLVFEFLIELAKRDGDLVTKEELIDALWDGRPIGDTPITRAVYQLRKHLDDGEHTYIETLKRRGYRLAKKVEPLAVEGKGVGEAASVKRTRRSSPVLRGLTIVLIVAFTATIVWRNQQRIARDCTSIAVEPFANYSADSAEAYLSYGFREELIKTLHSAPGLCVAMSDPEVARATFLPLTERLWLDAVLTGGVQRMGDTLKINYELVDVGSGDVVASDSVTGKLDELFDLQVDVAESVRDDLLPDAESTLITATRPRDFDAYQDYLRGLYAFERRGYDDNFERARRYFENTIEQDPAFGPAYLQLATAAVLAPVYVSEKAEPSFEKAIAIVRQGVAADDSIESAAGAVFGYIFHQRKEWTEAEIAYVRATTARVVDPNAFSWYSRLLASVGRLDAALEQALIAWRMDPDNAVINSRVALTYAWLGETAQAAEFFERSEQLGAQGSTHLLGYALFLANRGDVDKAGDVAKRAVAGSGASAAWVDAVLLALEDPSATPGALQAVDGAVRQGQLSPQVEIVTRTLLNDFDGAMSVARLLAEPGEAFEMDLLWIPEFEPIRRRPDFAALMTELKLADYWSQNGCRFEDARVRCAR